MLTETKIFAIHDRATLVSMLAQKLVPENEFEQAILARGGYSEPGSYIFFSTFSDGPGQFTYDAYQIEGRTFGTAAKYIQRNWDELESGEMLDCEVILGEKEPEDAIGFEEEFGFLL